VSLAGDEPISYLALERGTPVISADGETVPSANPAAVETTPDDTIAGGMGEEIRDKLRRAWDLISGNY
jgi:hypothetical protein